MKMRAWAILVAAAAGMASGQAYQAPQHAQSPSPLAVGASDPELVARADAGMQIERGRSAKDELEEHRKLDRALKTLAPERKGVVDAYVVSIAMDSDPVFGREAREAANVLTRRYDATGRSLVLAGSDGKAPSQLPRGTPDSLAIALARVAEVMNRDEDVLVLYETSHGAQFGLYYHDADSGFGAVSPIRLARLLDELGIKNRLLILSACYSGIFVPRLAGDRTAIVTAAAADRTSFGCAAENDWTYFGDAMINHALRKAQSLPAAFADAATQIGQWETEGSITPSNPQIAVGAAATTWLAALDQRMPKVETQPVGRPARVTTDTWSLPAGRKK